MQLLEGPDLQAAGGGAYPPPEVLFRPIRARRGQTCCQVTSERPDLISEEPSDPREEGGTLRRPESADLVCSPSAERPEKSGGFHTSWDGAHQQLGGGGGGGGGADGWQTARVCRVPQRVLVVLKSPVQHMEREAGGASQARRIHVVFASENESVESCEISSQQMGPLIRPRVPEAPKIRRNEEKKTGFGRPDERLRRGASSSPRLSPSPATLPTFQADHRVRLHRSGASSVWVVAPWLRAAAASRTVLRPDPEQRGAPCWHACPGQRRFSKDLEGFLNPNQLPADV